MLTRRGRESAAVAPKAVSLCLFVCFLHFHSSLPLSLSLSLSLCLFVCFYTFILFSLSLSISVCAFLSFILHSSLSLYRLFVCFLIFIFSLSILSGRLCGVFLLSSTLYTIFSSTIYYIYLSLSLSFCVVCCFYLYISFLSLSLSLLSLYLSLSLSLCLFVCFSSSSFSLSLSCVVCFFLFHPLLSLSSLSLSLCLFVCFYSFILFSRINWMPVRYSAPLETFIFKLCILSLDLHALHSMQTIVNDTKQTWRKEKNTIITCLNNHTLNKPRPTSPSSCECMFNTHEQCLKVCFYYVKIIQAPITYLDVLFCGTHIHHVYC